MQVSFGDISETVVVAGQSLWLASWAWPCPASGMITAYGSTTSVIHTDSRLCSMGFSNGLVSCALLRAFAGLMGSSIRVAVATMIGDVSHSPSAKARNFSRLPLVSTGGIIGPLLQAALVHRFSKDNVFWMRFPLFGSQMVCAALMLAVFAASYFLLEEVRAAVSNSPVCMR